MRKIPALISVWFCSRRQLRTGSSHGGARHASRGAALNLIMLSAALTFTSIASAQTPHLGVDFNCQPAEASLTYLCTVGVSDSAGKPIENAEVTLSADMPSMPMAHNVNPVKAQSVPGQPGRYQGRVTLAMLGEWAVKLRFQAPHQDVVVRKLNFQKDKVLSEKSR